MKYFKIFCKVLCCKDGLALHDSPYSMNHWLNVSLRNINEEEARQHREKIIAAFEKIISGFIRDSNSYSQHKSTLYYREMVRRLRKDREKKRSIEIDELLKFVAECEEEMAQKRLRQE